MCACAFGSVWFPWPDPDSRKKERKRKNTSHPKLPLPLCSAELRAELKKELGANAELFSFVCTLSDTLVRWLRARPLPIPRPRRSPGRPPRPRHPVRRPLAFTHVRCVAPVSHSLAGCWVQGVAGGAACAARPAQPSSAPSSPPSFSSGCVWCLSTWLHESVVTRDLAAGRRRGAARRRRACGPALAWTSRCLPRLESLLEVDGLPATACVGILGLQV